MKNEKQLCYVVSLTTTEQGGRGVTKIVGVFSDKEKSAKALDDVFHKTCDEYGVEELNDYSFYTEAERFNIEDDNDEFSVLGEITESEMDTIIDL